MYHPASVQGGRHGVDMPIAPSARWPSREGEFMGVWGLVRHQACLLPHTHYKVAVLFTCWNVAFDNLKPTGSSASASVQQVGGQNVSGGTQQVSNSRCRRCPGGQAPCGGCPPAGAGTWLVGNTTLDNNTNQNAAKHVNLKEKLISLYEGAHTAPSPPPPTSSFVAFGYWLYALFTALFRPGDTPRPTSRGRIISTVITNWLLGELNFRLTRKAFN